MASFGTYIPEEVVVLIAGILPVEGFLDGTFITVDKDVMPFVSVRTPDGTVSRLYNNDQTYTVQLTLHSGSSSNDVLTKFWQLDEITEGRGKFALMIKDNSGSDLFFSTNTWIEQVPTMAKSNGVDGRTWTLRSAFAVTNFGSNGEPSSILEDLANIVTSSLPALEGII